MSDTHIATENKPDIKPRSRVVTDGIEQPDKSVPLVDDRNHHNVDVDVG